MPLSAGLCSSAACRSAATTTPSPTAATNILATSVLSGVVLAAVIAATITIWQARRKSREEERNRLSIAFAKAFAAYSAYNQLPYAIRRRRADQAAEERLRLSEILREIQAELAYHQAWTSVESETVGMAYAELLQQMRRTAGTAMHEAWEAAVGTSDGAMNIPSGMIDLSSLKPYETAYLDAVRAHLDSITSRRGR